MLQADQAGPQEASGGASAAAFCFRRAIPAQAGMARPLEECSLEELFQAIGVCEARGGAEGEIDEAFAELCRRPVSLEMIERVVGRRGKTICRAERRLMTRIKRELPDLNRVLVSYELLKRETERMDLRRFRPRRIEVRGEAFEAYETQGAEFRFLVHAAGLQEGEIEEVKQKRIRSGFLCTSLICDRFPDFYEPSKNFAMVLAADPRIITATSREDAFTPYSSKDPGTMNFYRFYQRIQLLTSYVDRLYRELGMGAAPASDKMSRLNRLKGLEAQGIASPEMAAEAEALQRSVLRSEGRYSDVQTKYKTLGLAKEKIKEIEERLGNEPGLASKEQEADLARCKALLEEIFDDYSIFHDHIHPLQGCGDLISQTPSQPINNYNGEGTRPYNEINLDLSTRHEEGVDPIAVKAILIDEAAFQNSPNDFEKVLQDAKAKGIPILIRQDPLLSQEEVRNKFLSDAKRGSDRNLHKWIETGHIDGETAGQALILAVQSGAYYSCCAKIMRVPGIPERYLREAFLSAVEKRNDLTVSSFVSEVPEQMEEIIRGFMESNPAWIPPSLVDYLLSRGIELSPKAASLILRDLMQVYRPDAANAIYSRFKDRIPREELDEIFFGPGADEDSFCIQNIPEAEWERCIEKAIEQKNFPRLEKFFKVHHLLYRISGNLAEKALQAAEEAGAYDVALSIVAEFPQFEGRWQVYFQEAIERGEGERAYKLYTKSGGRLSGAAIAAIPQLARMPWAGNFLYDLFPYVDDIPPEHAGKFLKAALENRLSNRAVEIYRTFKESISEEELIEVSPLIAEWGSVELIREIMPPEQFRSCFKVAAERGHWLRMLYLAEEPLLDAHLLPEDFEFAVSSAIKDKIWASDLAQLISSRPSLRKRLRTLALEKAIETRSRVYLVEVAKALYASPQEIAELLRKLDDAQRAGGAKLGEEEFSKFSAEDFIDPSAPLSEAAGVEEVVQPSEEEEFSNFSAEDFIDAPAPLSAAAGAEEVVQPSEEEDFPVPVPFQGADEMAAGIARNSVSAKKAARAIGKKAPSLNPRQAQKIAHLAYAAMQGEKYSDPLAERLSHLSRAEFSAVQAYLIHYAGLPANRAKFGDANIDVLIEKVGHAVCREERLNREARTLAERSATLPKAVQAIGTLAPSLSDAQAEEIARFAYAGMQEAKFHAPLLAHLSQIPEPEFSKVKMYLLKYIRMPGNQEKFGLYWMLDSLESALRGAASAAAPLPVRKGKLKKREVAVQPAVTLGSLSGMALSAIKAPFHLMGWAASGVLNACRKKPALARA